MLIDWKCFVEMY